MTAYRRRSRTGDGRAGSLTAVLFDSEMVEDGGSFAKDRQACRQAGISEPKKSKNGGGRGSGLVWRDDGCGKVLTAIDKEKTVLVYH